MDHEKQAELISAARAEYERIVYSSEASRKRELVETLLAVPVGGDGCSGWFGESIVEGQKMATRIYRATDEEVSEQNERVFKVQVGVTSEAGGLHSADPMFLVVDYATIEFADSAEGRREVTVSLRDDSDIEWHSNAWQEVYFTVLEAHDLIEQATHS